MRTASNFTLCTPTAYSSDSRYHQLNHSSLFGGGGYRSSARGSMRRLVRKYGISNPRSSHNSSQRLHINDQTRSTCCSSSLLAKSLFSLPSYFQNTELNQKVRVISILLEYDHLHERLIGLTCGNIVAIDKAHHYISSWSGQSMLFRADQRKQSLVGKCTYYYGTFFFAHVVFLYNVNGQR